MYNPNQFLAKNAQDSLSNTKMAQEQKRLAMLREQKMRDLTQLETQLFYKKQEVVRLKTLHDRLRREAVNKQSVENKEEREAKGIEHQIKDAENRIAQLDQDVTRTMSEISDKIAREKAVLLEHQKNVDALEKQKRETESKTATAKRALAESFSRLMFFRKNEDREAANAKRLFESNQKQLQQVEHSLKAFTQETTVLENKIRALRGAIK